MDTDFFLAQLRDALSSITNPRYYENERGFQGVLHAELHARLSTAVLPIGAILEPEHQKSVALHRLRIRPDLIVHEPFDPSIHDDRGDGNHAVIELKLQASHNEANGDIGSLVSMIETLRYPLGVFINIASNRTYFNLVPDRYRSLLACFAVNLNADRTVEVHHDGPAR